jgi:hypothetical protein
MRRRKPTLIIKEQSQLPAWYKLEKYLQAKNFSLEEWFNAFYVRQTVSRLFGYRARGEVYRTYWNEIQNRGALAYSSRKGFAASVGFEPLRSLEVIDLFEIRDSIAADEPYKRHYQKFNRELKKSTVEGPGVSPHEKLKDTVREALDPNTYWMHNAAFLVVDLDASNATLTKSFEGWLQRVRSEEKETFRHRRYSARDSKSWSDSGVLQFMDLTHWAKTQKLRIPDWLMGEAIFLPSRSVNVSEAVRKVTRPLAHRVLSEKLLENLGADIYSASANSAVP